MICRIFSTRTAIHFAGKCSSYAHLPKQTLGIEDGLSDPPDPGDLKRMQTVLLVHGQIIADEKSVGADMRNSFIGKLAANVIMEGPGTAWLAHNMADIVWLIWAETDDAAVIPMVLPQAGVDPACFIEWQDQRVSDLRIAFRMTLFACQLQPYAVEGGRELSPILLTRLV